MKRKNRLGTDPRAGLAYIQPSNGSPELETIDDLLRAILRQLSEEEFSGLSAPARASKRGPKSWSRQQIQIQIRDCASRMSKVFLFIDAIDELMINMGPGLLASLLKCQQQCNAYMIFTSTSIDSRLVGYPVVEFKARDDDISKYIESEALSLRRGLLHHTSGSLPVEVSRRIIEISDGL